MPETFLTEREFSDRFKIPARTAQRWRSTGDGPPFVRLGPRRVAYRLSDIEAWAASRTFASRAAEIAHLQSASR
jgi:predicted DNA-binding transcriptional regulator AlpA